MNKIQAPLFPYLVLIIVSCSSAPKNEEVYTSENQDISLSTTKTFRGITSEDLEGLNTGEFNAFIIENLDPSINTDFDPPTLSNPAYIQTSRSEWSISITAHDEVEVENVLVYFRNISEHRYQFREMASNDSDKATYSATIDLKDAVNSGIEFYFVASDSSGNIARNGDPHPYTAKNEIPEPIRGCSNLCVR